MAIVSSFLCWSNTRTGSAVCGYYTLVISVLCLAFYMLRYIALDQMKDSIELKGIVYAGFVLYSFLIGVSLILLPGVYMDRKLLLLPWIYVLVITVLYETGAIALVTTVHLEEDHTLNTWEIVAVAFYCFRLVANCYCFACVVSQYQELSEGRGTYEFLFKPRRRHQARGVPLSDLDEYNPPYGATLPPYSEENPFKEFSPPNYENLALSFDDYDSSMGIPRGHSSPCSSYRGGASASGIAEVIVNTSPLGRDDSDISIIEIHHPRNSSDYPHRHRRGRRHSGGRSSRSSRRSKKKDSLENSRVPSDCSHDSVSAVNCQNQIDSYLPGYHGNESARAREPQSIEDVLEVRPQNKQPVAMTESSGSVSTISLPNSTHHSRETSQSSMGSSTRPYRTSPVIQKRTYITWI